MMTACLLPVMLGFVALSIDMGYIVVVRGQLQNTADAAALAGVSVLQQSQVMTAGNAINISASQNAAIAAARAKARQFSALNTAGGVSVTIPANSDIVVGYQSTPGGSITPTSPPDLNFPNVVQVTVRRDSTANTPLSLFFAPAIGIGPWSGTATAAAAVQGSISSFRSIPGVNGKLLPIAINVVDWNAFLLTGRSNDGLVHDDYSVSSPSSSNPSPNNVSNGNDSIPEFVDSGFPAKTGLPGAFGWVDVGQASGGVPTLDNYINNGDTPADISWLLSNGCLPFPSTTGWSGEPGKKSSADGILRNIIGQQREVMLYDTSAGAGSHVTYHMVGVAGVTVVDAGNGVTLQPSVVIDPTAISGSGLTFGNYVFSAVKLTR